MTGFLSDFTKGDSVSFHSSGKLFIVYSQGKPIDSLISDKVLLKRFVPAYFDAKARLKFDE